MRWPIAGVIEGFYGRPWSWDERIDVMRHCAARGMTHYVYAPKDDPKHRAMWQEPYDEEELSGFARMAEESGVSVGFAVSPGLTIDYGSEDDRAALLGKLEQVLDHGVSLVCLALDDIPDRPGLGQDHAVLTTWVRDRLGERCPLVLVPTQYVGTECTAYLDALAEGVPDDVPIAWTGVSVVNDAITVDDARRRAEALGGRAPLLWDNYPVNDGLMGDRLFLGPLWGRDRGLVDACSGYLANPMVQPGASKLPLTSVAAWLQGDDPIEAWAWEAGDMRVFAEACDGGVPLALVDALADEGGGPGWSAAATPLAGWLSEATSVTAPRLEHEVQPWLDQVRAEAVVALDALLLYQATKPAVVLDADGRGRAAGVSDTAVLLLSFRLAASWLAITRSPVSAMGPRRAFRPSVGQREGGGWALLPEAVQEDANATDHLVRLALREAVECSPGPLWVGADGSEVEVDEEGYFQVDPGSTVLVRSGRTATRAVAGSGPPLTDRRL